MRRKVLFIDRDGTMVNEAPPTYQLDHIDKVRFYPGALTFLARIAEELDYELVMVTNQDGLGTDAFPEAQFWPVQQLILDAFSSVGVQFSAIHIDRSYPADQAPTRKPGTGMLTAYLDPVQYDLEHSFVIGDRVTDVQLAKNLGCKAIWLNNDPKLGAAETSDSSAALQEVVALETTEWNAIYEYLKLGVRELLHERITHETRIRVQLNLDGSGKSEIRTGLGFFDHMLDQLARHGGLDLMIEVAGDLHIDEHHTIEDTALALGEAFGQALTDKRGMERYGYALPMDDAEAKVLLDFGGRSWLVWNAVFQRERIGEMPTEMFFHFFKSFSDAAKCNLHVECRGENEHHKIEAIFKAFARAIRMAVRRDPFRNYLPSTKGVL